jgi:Fe2+ or Zn2+ uptake regulation protein
LKIREVCEERGFEIDLEHLSIPGLCAACAAAQGA